MRAGGTFQFGPRAITGAEAAPSPTGGMPGRIGAGVAAEVADAPVAAGGRDAALTRRLQDQVDRNEAEWFIESFDDQLAKLRETEQSARTALTTQETLSRGKFAKEGIAEYKRDVGLGGGPWVRDPITARGNKPPASSDPNTLAAYDAAVLDTESRVAGTRIKDAADGRVPPRGTGKPFGENTGAPPPRDPDIAFGDDMDIPVHENVEKTSQRKFESALNAEDVNLSLWDQEATALAKTTRLPRRSFSAENMDDTFRALHGEIDPSTLTPAQRQWHGLAARLRDIEQEDMYRFLTDIESEGAENLLAYDVRTLRDRMDSIDPYFNRMWKPLPEEAAQAGMRRGGFMATPGAARPRNPLTYSEMRQLGYEPASWDPVAMAINRRWAGVQYRTQVRLVNFLKQRDLILPLDEVPDPKKWRVPNVGSVFQGRQIPAATAGGDVVYTRQLAVPNNVANFIEEAFGTTTNLQTLRAIRQQMTKLKRLKLIGSFFQHYDFGWRAVGFAFSPTGILKGAPVKLPSLMLKMITTQLSKTARADLRKNVFTKNYGTHNGQQITGKMLTEEGWGAMQGDISLIKRSFIENIVDPISANPNLGSKIRDRLGKMREFWEGGLFDGTYVAVHDFAMENLIIPSIRRKYPKATARQVAAMASEEANLALSTLARWQTVLKDPAVRELAQTGVFSTNESEGLLTGFYRMFTTKGGVPIGRGKRLMKSPNGQVFREWYLGLFIGMAVFANLINIMATGKPMPLSAYNPIKPNDPYAPFKVGYNNRFLSPQIPYFRGRNDTPIYLDVVGQMDTAFRWILSPWDAMSARLNVGVRALQNQVVGESFFGEKLDSIQKRALQFATDIGAPITITHLIGAAREQIPGIQDVVTEGEGRLGPAQALQVLGPNIRAEPTAEMLDRFAQQELGVQTYGELEPHEKRRLREVEPLAQELADRQATGISRQQETTKTFARLDQLDQIRFDAEEENLALYNQGRMDITEFRRRYYDLQDERRIASAERSIDFEFDDLPPDDPNRQAFEQYIEAFNTAKTDADLDAAMDQLQREWAAAGLGQGEYILRNTNDRKHPEGVVQLLSFNTQLRIDASEQARARFSRTGGSAGQRDGQRVRPPGRYY
jgi:hypothetical protein